MFSVAGWILLAIGLLMVPLWAVFIIECKAPLWENIKAASKPKENWGPKSVATKRDWEKFKDEKCQSIIDKKKFQEFLRALFK